MKLNKIQMECRDFYFHRKEWKMNKRGVWSYQKWKHPAEVLEHISNNRNSYYFEVLYKHIDDE